jgi:PKD repeat protein
MTKVFTCLLLFTLVVLVSIPVHADDGNTTTVPTTTATTTVPTTTATMVVTTAPPAPGASFTGSPTSGTAPLTVQFTDTSTGSPTSWSWDFGDGGSSLKQDPSHTYATPGSYTVVLTVAGAAGSSTSTGSRITVLSPGASQSPISPLAGVGAVGIVILVAGGMRGRKGRRTNLQA